MNSRLIHVLVAAVTTSACGGDEPFAEALEISGPVALRDSLVWIDRTRHELVTIAPEAEAIATTRQSIGDDDALVLWATATGDGETLLALTGPASDKREDIEERLLAYANAEDGPGLTEPREFVVGAPFDRVAISPDQSRAVLYFGTGTTPQSVLHNANQIAVVELDPAAPVAVRTLTLNGFGGRIAGVEFPGGDRASAVTIGDRSRELVAFLAEGEIVLLDAADDDSDQVAVRFLPDITFSPEQTLLRAGNALFPNPALFLRSSASSDVAMLTLVADPGTETGFTAQVSLLPIGTGASDFTLHDSDDVPYLVTADPGNARITFTDIRTQQGFAVAIPAGSVHHLLERDAETGPQLIVWAPGGTTIATLELAGIENALGRQPHRIEIPAGIDDLVQLDNDRLLASSGTDLYVIDLPRDQIAPLAAQASYDPNTSILVGDRLLLGTPGQPWLSTVDLEALRPESMLLDDPVRSFHYLPGSGQTVVVHDDPAGHVTITDGTQPTRASSYSAWGFLYADLL